MHDAAICIAFSSDRKAVCLIKRRDVPVWVLPGGGIEQGESPEEAALREMKEETGYEAKIVRKVAEYAKANRLTHPAHFFEVKIVGGKPKLGKETQGIDFFFLDNLPKHIPPTHLYWIEDAVASYPFVLHKKVEGASYWMLLRHLFSHPILVGRFLLTKLKP